MLSEVFSSSKVRMGCMAKAQLAGEVVIVHMLPQLLPTVEMYTTKAAEGVGRRQMSLQLLLIGKHRQLQREGSVGLQRKQKGVRT